MPPPDETNQSPIDEASDVPAPADRTQRPPIDEADRVIAPAGGLLTPQEQRQKDRDKTRDRLAWTLTLILAAVVVVGCIGWLWRGNDVDRMQSFAILFGPITTLLGTVLGFYFSSYTDN